MQDLERRLADRERDQRTPEQSHSRYLSRSRSRRTPSPQGESESTEERGRARRRHDPVIYARREGRRTTNREDEDARRENDDGRTNTRGHVIIGATPFHRSILEVRLPKHFDKPTDMRYDGTQDPLEHLTAFEARMNLKGVGDEVRCRTFPVTLAGSAIRWFNNLPQDSVTQFSDISHALLAQFTTRIAKAKHPINLLGVTQKAREPTRKYLDRFNDECLKIDGLTDSVASLCLTNGLLNEDFRKHLTTKPVWTMQEIQCVAKEYINDEEVSRVVAANKRQPAYNQARHYEGREKPREHAREHARDGGPSKASKPFSRVGKFTNYTPLTAPITEVYQQIAEKGILKKLRPLKGRTGGDKSLYYEYHKGYGHKTQDCFDLKDALEQAIRDGKLADFSHLIREPRRRNRDHEGEDSSRAARQRREPEGDDHGLTVVNVVTARNSAPRSKSAQKKDAKVLAVSSSSARSSRGLPSIPFGPEDQWFDEMPESPPMVITARVGTGLVKRILVDTGADSNIMFQNVFDVLGLRDADLATHQHAYNIISGRKTINDLGAAISTKLLVMKFVADDRSVGSIRGDLETAVACDHATLSLRKKSKEASGVFLADLDARIEDKPRPEPEGDLEKFRVGDGDEKFMFINRNLPHELKEPLMEMIRANADLFAWTPADMLGIDPQLLSHHLAVKPEAKPRLMNKIFSELIGKTVEVYVDDILAKTTRPDDLLSDLGGVFASLRQHSMRLNPLKCAFAMEAEKFLGFMITQRGVEANPEKCQAILQMKSPGCIKDVQRLAGRLTALSRFLGASAAKALPFFNLMKKRIAFEWIPACEEAFNHFKEILAAPPVLGKPKAGESLYLYLAVTEEALAAVLVREEGKAQQPIYFVSRALQGAELRYNKLKKLALTLLTSSRRLRQYFQGHRIVMRTDQAIRQVLQKPDLAGRMMTWAIELSQYDLQYEPRHAIKAQAMADFLVEAEYEALLSGLILAREVGATKIEVCSDSQVVTSQVNGSYQARDPLLQKYLEKVKEMTSQFQEVTIQHVPRERNTRADHLSKLASTKPGAGNRSLIQGMVKEPTIALHLTESSPSWLDPIINFLEFGKLPDDEKAAKTLRREAARYAIIQGQLFRKGLSQPLLKCLHPDQTDYVLREVHEGCCGHHIGGKALARKLIRAGYYWPSMMKDSREFVRKCVKCQQNANFHKAPASELSLLTTTRPFAQWGVDLLGPFPVGPGQVKYLIVAIDYNTKWIEAEPLASISSSNCRKFMWRQVITRFGIPEVVISDNGTQFTDKKFTEFLTGLGVKQKFSSVEHPQTNGQVESANKVILLGLKKRLDNKKGAWADELASVL
ncbi:uncharacterized protein [Arachis hypogaea]|uniref:uncharacterized protein n=1 Tax=Arachis hypogaea TaxID=3818 RepID=UPI003B20C5B1